MDAEDLRRLLRSSGVDLWALMDTAVFVAAADHADELRARRDGIVERLYAPPAEGCRNCGPQARPPPRRDEKGSGSPAMKRAEAPPPSPPSPESVDSEEEENVEEERRGYDRSIDVEKRKILAIKESLEDPDQSEDFLVSLLQSLADMDITFKALEETDIGRHVNGLRKHPSNEVRGLVKHLVRKWKDLVGEWVKSNPSNDNMESPAIITDGDSPQQNHGKNHQNGLQTPERGNTPHSHNGYSSSERISSEIMEPKAKVNPPRREAPPTKPSNNSSTSCTAATHKPKEQQENLIDPERLASARRRLHENYQEAQNAKKQRTIQVMDIHEIPKPKNSFARKGGFQAKHR